MESESGITNTKISDSGYSNSCSNSNSQRSASSKSRHSGSNSSRGSGYCGAPNVDASADPNLTAPSKRNKDREPKKKKLKSNNAVTNTFSTPASVITITKNRTVPLKNATPEIKTGTESLTTTTLEQTVPSIENQESNKDCVDEVHTTTIQPAGDILALWNEDVKEQDAQNNEIEDKVAPSPVYTPVINCVNKLNYHPEAGFCCVISMYDGVVLYTTPSLTTALGFPKDMWLGRSFIDFVHPKDRETFSNQIATVLALPIVDSMGKCKDIRNTLYVCLRKYRGFKALGYSMIEKSVTYEVFQLTMTFKHIADSEKKFLDNSGGMFLVVVAVPVCTSYKVPEETRKSSNFGMRHTAACIFSHVDPDVVTNFGFLPQDMLGKSVFDFYHPDDMPFLKEVYESVMRMCQIAGSVFRSKPYRFAVQNGGFAMIETEWSTFVNPWSRRLEFVIGLHRVLQGPTNPNVFDTRKDDKMKHISEEVLKESKIIKEEILILLNKELARPIEIVKQEVSKRCKGLATFMESLMDEVSKTTLQLNILQDPVPTISERDSVMLGEISPHHDYYDSKSSSETPPSYNQLNYNENIQRFFQSKPKTTSSDESGLLQSATDTDLEAKSLSAVQDRTNNQKCLSPVQNSGASGSGSAGNLSSGSNPNLESTTTGTNTSNDSYIPPHLTKALLFKHNEDMEKIMIKRHREHRTSIKADRENKKSHRKTEKNKLLEKTIDKNENHGGHHGVKRSGSHSCEKDSRKISKYKHQTENFQKNGSLEIPSNFGVDVNLTLPPQTTTPSGLLNSDVYTSGLSNLWPPFSVTLPPVNNTQTCGISSTANTNSNFTAGMFPLYYIPAQQRSLPPDQNIPTGFPVQYMPGMMYNYNPIFSAPSIFCSPLPMVPVPLTQPIAAINPETTNPTPALNMPSTEHKLSPPSVRSVPQFQRPASQATSVKAEPGSAMGSIASASVANKAMSECSRKDLGLQSVCSPDSPLVSPPGDETDMENFIVSKIKKNIDIRNRRNNKYHDSSGVDEESSYSSFYSSFLKTDTGSGSNDDSTNVEQRMLSDHRCKHYPNRKRDPPWLEAVSVTPELIYRYQMSIKGIEDILESDLNTLKAISQPMLVNDQLNQLYIEMELEGLSTKLTLDEGITSSSSSSDETIANMSKPKKRRNYSSLMMIYEENAPFPSDQ